MRRYFSLLSGFILLSVALSACGESTPPPDPSLVAEDYLEALVQGDLEAVEVLVCDEKKAEMMTRAEAWSDAGEYAIENMKYETIAIDDEDATVHYVGDVTLEQPGVIYGGSWDDDMQFVLEDGSWKVCDVEAP